MSLPAHRGGLVTSRDLLTCGGKIASGDFEVAAERSASAANGRDLKPSPEDSFTLSSADAVLQTRDPGWAIADGSVGDS